MKIVKMLALLLLSSALNAIAEDLTTAALHPKKEV